MRTVGPSAGVELVVSTFVGAGVGLGLDKLLGTLPFLTIPCMVLGMVGGLWMIARGNSD